MRKTRLLLGCLGWGLLVLASVEAQDGGYSLQGWAVSSYNDNTPYLYDNNGVLNLSIGRGADDQFTAGFRIDTVGDWKTPWSDTLLASANWAAFTDDQYYAIGRNGAPDHPPWRMDVGSLQFLLQKNLGPFTVDYGLAGVVRGNLGGEAVQDLFHSAIQDIQFRLTYPGDYTLGPVLRGGLTYHYLDAVWAGWNWKSSGTGRAVWDVLRVVNDEADALVELAITSGPVQFSLVGGYRVSLPGSAAFLSSMYSGGMFFDDTVELNFGDLSLQFGYAINPYGAAPISQYPAYKDMNQEFHWSIGWGKTILLPWALRFFP